MRKIVIIVAGVLAALVIADRAVAIQSGGRGILELAIFHLKSSVTAVDRTAYDKLADWISCKDYGAKGDGLSDDTAAIDNCVAAASSTQLLNLPCPGTYITSTYPPSLACGVYYPPVSGAVPRSVARKLYDQVSVLDFGAVGDGATDDTTAIRNAVAAGKSVYFPSLNFKITGPIYITTTGQQLYANGTTITTSGATTTAFFIGSTNGSDFVKTDKVIIDGFNIVGAADGTGSPTTLPVGIFIQHPSDNPYVDGNGCSGVVISNNNVSGFLAGVHATAADRLTVINNRFSGMKYYSSLTAGGYGVLLQTVFHSKISQNKFVATSTDRHSIYISADPDRTANNNNVCKDVIVNNNAIDWTALNGVGATGFEAAVVARAPEDLVFNGNTVLGGYGGIDYDLLNGNGINTSITGNVFRKQYAGTSERATINYLRSSGSYTGTGLNITGNVIDVATSGGLNTHGIQLSYISDVAISGNVIRNNGISNIDFGNNATDIIVSGNMLECVASYCYQFAGTGVARLMFGRNKELLSGGALFTMANAPTGMRFGYNRCATLVANSTGSPTFNSDNDGIVTSVATDANGIKVTFNGLVTSGSSFQHVLLNTHNGSVATVYNRNQTNPLIVGVLGTAGPFTALGAATNSYEVTVCLTD